MLRSFVVALLAFTFVANAQCAASCLSFTSDTKAAHDCCKPNKAPGQKQCLNQTKPPAEAVVKAKSIAEKPWLGTASSMLLLAGETQPRSNPNAAPGQHPPPAAHTPSLLNLRI